MSAACRSTRLVAAIALILVGRSPAAATVERGSGGCAKLYTSISSAGVVAALQSYATDCATPVSRPCHSPTDELSDGSSSFANDFVLRADLMRQTDTGWTRCETISSTSGYPACAIEPRATNVGYLLALPGGVDVSGVAAYLASICGSPGWTGWMKIVARGRLRTTRETLELMAESNAVYGSYASGGDACSGKNCDDGNACTADSCAAGHCRHAFGSACLAGVRNVLRETESARVCPAEPSSGCSAMYRASSAELKIEVTPARKVLQWKWSGQLPSAQSPFGQPTAGDDYTLCVYAAGDGGPPTVTSTHLPSAGDCASRGCWKRTARGLAFKEASAARKLSASLSLASNGLTRIDVKATGLELDMPGLPMRTPLRIQLIGSNGACWETEHADKGVSRNDGVRVRARN